MIGITILALYLLLLFALLTLALFLSLLALSWWRRRSLSRTAAEAPSEVSTEPHKSPSKELIYYFCWKNRARVEPAEAEGGPETGSPTKLREPAAEEFERLYSRSRVLYTINEEKETETEVEEEDSFDEEVDIENDPQKFYSPLSSPQYYTPYSSPSREDPHASGPPDALV